MRMLLALVLLAAFALVAGPAFAQIDPCVSDPLACVEDVAEDATQTVEDTEEEVTQTAEDTVDEVVGPLPGDPVGGDDPSPTGGGSRGGQPQPGGGRDGGAEEGRDGLVGADAGTGASTSEPRGAAARQREPDRTFERPQTPPQGDVLERITNALTDGPAALTFPVVLLVILGSFMLVQSRIDRDDPKLSLAPVDASEEALSFG